MIKAYEKYKSSNITWIGNIPEHWMLTKTKFCSSFRMGQTILKEELIEDGEYPVFSATEGDHYFGRTNSPSFVLEVGDIVIPARGNSIGHIALVHETAVSTQTTIANFVNKQKINSHYLFYFYKGFRKTLFHYDNTAIPQITVDQVKQNPVLLPTFQEQTKIAKYLDHQTTIIDQLIQQKEKLIELLKEKRQSVINEAVTKGLNPNAKMKDSGIDSFGSIPENWVVTKLKYLSNVKGRIGFRGYTTDDLVEEGNGALALGASHITWEGEIDLSNPVFISWPKYEESPEIKLNTGDIIIVQRGSTCGKVAIISSEIGPATINPSLVVLKEIQANPYYVFISIKAALQELVNLTRSAAIPMLSQDQIGNLQIVLPPIEEQKIISDFLQETKSHFNDSIIKLNESISKLYEYRQSIISEAVTGKIDVRDWQPNKQQVA